MLFKARPARPSHTTVAVYLALFVALGGSAYAAAKIGSEEIIDDSVTSADIKNRTLITKDFSNKTLQDIKNLKVTVRRGPSITVGANENRSTSADCGPGETVVGGGGSATPGSVLQDSIPDSPVSLYATPTRWTVTYQSIRTSGISAALAFAVCIG